MHEHQQTVIDHLYNESIPLIMNYGLPLLGSLIFFVLFLQCGTKPPVSNNQSPPEVKWTAIDSLIEHGKIRTALEEVEQIVRKLESVSDDQADKIKAAVYYSRLKSETEDDHLLNYIDRLREQRDRWSQPGRSLLSWYLAEAYEQYFLANRWKIQERSSGAYGPENQPEFWSMDQFIDQISTLYLESVRWNGLKEYSIEEYKPLVKPVEFEELEHISLYEMLGHRVIEYFSSPTRYITRPTYAFILNDAQAFSAREEFASWDIHTRDTSSFDFRALRLFQQMLEMYGADLSAPAVLTDLDRLAFAHRQAELDGKDSLYFSALEQLSRKTQDHPIHSTVLHRRASFLYDRSEEPNAWKHALELCRDAIARYPESNGASLCKNLKARLTQEELTLRIPRVAYPDENILSLAEWRNLETVHWNLYSLSRAEWSRIQSARDPSDTFRSMNKHPLKSGQLELPAEDDLKSHSVEWGLPPLGQGMYLLTAHSNTKDQPANKRIQLFQVSPWAVALFGDDQHSFLRVTDRNTGQALSDLTVQLHRWVRQGQQASVLKQFATFNTDSNGEVDLESIPNKNFRVTIKKGDQVYISNAFLNTYRRGGQSTVSQRTYFFTDRAIYRPGQTLHFKVLLTEEKEGKYPQILAKKGVRVTLRDANYQEIHSVELKTNAYGSAKGSIVLPSTGLSGRFTLESSIGRYRKIIRVEEYKRPSFQVELDEAQSDYQIGDTLEMSGKATNYAGNPIDGGQLRWKVIRNQYLWSPYDYGIFPPPGGREERIIAVGRGRTAPDGSFLIHFPLDASGTHSQSGRNVFSFEIEAEVTDVQGETQHAIRRIRAGHKPFQFRLNNQSFYSITTPDSLVIESLNWDGQGISRQGEVKLQLLEPSGRILRDRQWPVPDRTIMERDEFVDRFPHDPYMREDQWKHRPVDKTLAEDRFRTNREGTYHWTLPEDLPAGVYRIQIRNKDQQVKLIRHFEWIPSQGDARTEDLLSAQLKTSTAEPGDTVDVFLSTPLNNLPLLVRVKRMNAPIEIHRLILDGNDILRFPIRASDRGGLRLNITGNGLSRTLVKDLQIDIPWTNKKLDIHWTRIRDELMPGEETEWTLQISAQDQSVPQAEFLATLYDASLDAIEHNDWSIPSKPHLSYLPQVTYLDFGTDQFRPYYMRLNLVQAREYSWPEFEQLSYFYYRNAIHTRAHDEAIAFEQPGQESGKQAATPNEETEKGSKDIEEERPSTSPPLRENFDETVFFFPQLTTDSSGSIRLNFRMNEALTRWRLMGFAHSKDLKMARTDHEVVTRKDFMVFPNVPRFLREGDRIRLSAKVVNQSERSIHGKGQLKLTNLVDGEALSNEWIQSEHQPDFQLSPGRSKAIYWTVQVPDEFKGILQIELLATAGELSDGERHTLPVLSQDILMTETLPLPVGSKEKKTFTFKAMKKPSIDRDPVRFTLEFSPNPSWYAVKSLPWLANPKSENSEQIFNQLFANELAAHIARVNPQIKSIFELWALDDEALKSELLKNEELKQSLLEETPWVMDALRETDQRKQIARLFEPNQIDYARTEALQKLREHQLPSGAFPWFQGGRENFYMSLYLLEGFGRLHQLGLLDNRPLAQSILDQLISYSDRAAVEWFELHRRDEASHAPAYILLQYLKARSDLLKSHPMPNATDELSATVFTQIKNQWQNLNLFGQGLCVLIMHRYDFEGMAQNILTSIEERALYDDEMGMYWRNESGYNWYQRPIEQHVLLMQCFDELRGADDQYEKLRIWLLKQKQTQHWENSKSTASAVYALLMRGEDWLSDQQEVIVHLGDRKIRADTEEAGSGYFKKSWKEEEIGQDFSDISVDNPNNHIAWGAAYYQYFTPMKAVGTAGAEDWSIDKTYYQLELSEDGEKRVPMSSGEPIQVGDKILVRLEVRTDRTVNYIHIKDNRVSAMEPLNQKSEYRWREGVGYYENPRDLATHFFMDYLPKGTYVFEYELYATQSGSFSAGPAVIQCYYAPEFSAHSSGSRLSIEE